MTRARGSGKRSSNKHRCVFAPRHGPFFSTSRFRRRCMVAIIEMVCPQAETSSLVSKLVTLETKEGAPRYFSFYPIQVTCDPPSTSWLMDTTSNGSPTPSYRQATTPIVDSMALSRPLHLRRRKLEIDVIESGNMSGPRWKFPTMGTSEELHVPLDQLAAIQRELDTPCAYLRELTATAICGNDILVSVLYSASSVAAKAGKFMPVPVLFISIVLFTFRFIYEEVVTAIPLNRGTYNALLNTTSKRTVAVAACLSILSYVTTAVASTTTGVRYLNNQVTVPIVGCTIILLDRLK
ncbi:hypothetical protein PsorP6_007185 [Peronosclerospora sorghi]|uniref:Uncharacterized protein n=1 Tax=Peronosclerospora sorghi TaxID=230839 RepID=A0ACC0WAI8_9STRA|nr:hypothetical protein PsorP6_007185 [Peronosclerospora sorghi]